MAEYRIIYWRHIPVMVIASENGVQARASLPPRFQAAVDAHAMATGNIDSKEYSAGWRKSACKQRDGSPEEVAESVAAELESAFDTQDKLVIAALDYLQDQFRTVRDEQIQVAEGPREKLRAVLEHQKNLVLTERNILELYYDYWAKSAKRQPVRDKLKDMYATWRADLTEIILEGIEGGDFATNEAEVVTQAIIALSQGAALQSIIDPESFDVQAYFELVDRALVNFLDA